MERLRIAFVTSEIAPFAKTGGLADVAAGLSRYLGAAGHDVRLFMPLYPRVRAGGWTLEPLTETVSVSIGATEYRFQLVGTPLPAPGGEPSTGVRVCLVDCPALYDRPELYTEDADEPVRFALLCRAAIEGCQRLSWSPDVFHLNDWHTGLLPLYLKTAYAWDALFEKTRTLLTIHNIGYQGNFGEDVLPRLGLMGERQHLPAADLDEGRVSFLRTGLEHADAISTVSRTYAEEIQTSEFGMGLEDLLRKRRDVLTGIVNGVDYGDWDPSVDPLIPHRYSPGDLTGKLQDKQALLDEFGLAYDGKVPLFGVVSRFTGQKGFELLPDVLPVLLHEHGAQLAVLGSGETKIESYFQWLRDRYPGQVAVYKGYSNELAHRIEAGADLFLMPSRYEPCGLNQMYSLKYGTVPIVRRTGGLADTVEPFDAATGRGTGFLFDAFDSTALLEAVRAALAVWAQPESWRQLVQNGMSRDWSWDRQGPEYDALYASLVGGVVESSGG